MISVIIPTCRYSSYLEESIDSVLIAQNTDITEIIVLVNAGDQSQEVQNQINTKYDEPRLRVENTGTQQLPIYANWNYGVKLAKNPYIHILHDDDRVLKGFYQEASKLIEQSPEASLYYLNATMFEGTQKTPFKHLPSGRIDNLAEIIFDGNKLLCPGAIINKTYFRPFKEWMIHHGDWICWFEMSLESYVICSDQVLAEYRLHPQSSTNENIGSPKLAHKFFKELVWCLRFVAEKNNKTPNLELALEFCQNKLQTTSQSKNIIQTLNWGMKLFWLKPSFQTLNQIRKFAKKAL